MVTAELAFASLVGAVLLIVASWMISVGVQQMRCVDLAEQVARQEARGDHEAARQLAAKQPQATVEIARRNQTVVVQVHMETPRLGSLVPTVTLTATAAAALEPGE